MRYLAPLALAALAWACQSRDEQAKEYSAFFTSWRETLCPVAAGCGTYDTLEGCQATYRDPSWTWPLDTGAYLAEDSDARQAILAGRARFDSGAAQECLEALRVVDCSKLGSFRCPRSLVVGQVPQGGSCFTAFDSDGALFCDSTGSRCPGICRLRKVQGQLSDQALASDCAKGLAAFRGRCEPLGTQSDPCDPVPRVMPFAPRCGPDFYCDFRTATCQRWRGLSESCDANNLPTGCGRGLHCQDGTCLALAGIHESCAPGQCKRDLRCSDDPASQRCEGLHLTGEFCRSSGDCAPGNELYCQWTSLPAEQGFCAARQSEGGACDVTGSDADSGCRLDLACDPRSLSCVQPNGCLSPFCVDSRCHEPVAE